jgi:hypothetical protein
MTQDTSLIEQVELPVVVSGEREIDALLVVSFVEAIQTEPQYHLILSDDQVAELVSHGDTALISQILQLTALPAVRILGKSFMYNAGGALEEVSLYRDSARTVLYQTLTLLRTLGVLTSVVVRDSGGSIVQTKTLEYGAGGVLTGITTS